MRVIKEQYKTRTLPRMDNLIHRRQVMNLTREELGKLSGVNVYTITEYELGGRVPKLDKMKKLAEALNCTVDDIM